MTDDNKNRNQPEENTGKEEETNGAKKHHLTKKFLTVAGIVVALLLLLVFIIANSVPINKWLSSVLQLFRPIILGLVLAYVLNPVFRFLERKALRRIHPLRLRRVLSLVFSYLFLALIFAVLVALIVPQLVSSIASFAENYPTYMESAVGKYNGIVDWVDKLLARFDAAQNFLQRTTVEEINNYLSDFLKNSEQLISILRKWASTENTSNIIDAVGGVIAALADIIFAFFISLYLLATKERLYAQVMKFRRAVFGDRTNAFITRVCTVADNSFGSFLEGKFFDSLIIGILTYFVMIIFRIPYPILIAAIIGITNIIPVIGPIFGAIPTAVIVLLTEPAKVIPFLIIVLTIQQIDGNIIGPKILGNSNGVSSLCVLIAITVMGNIWGLIGMLLGVPLFATVLELLDTVTEEKLRAKGLPSATENYYPANSPLNPAIDMQSGSEKNLHRWERKVLHLRIRIAQGQKISFWDRIGMGLYEHARKLSILPEISSASLAQFAVDEAVRNEEKELKQHRNENK